MALESLNGLRIREKLSSIPSSHRGYYDMSGDSKKYKDWLVEYVFGNSKINLPHYLLKGSLGLWSFRALAEQDNFERMARKDKRVLSLTDEIKGLYLEIAKDKGLNASDFVDKHLLEAVKVLADPYMTSDEFVQRASSLKRNLAEKKQTYVPRKVLFPNFHYEQKRLEKKKKSNSAWRAFDSEFGYNNYGYAAA